MALNMITVSVSCGSCDTGNSGACTKEEIERLSNYS